MTERVFTSHSEDETRELGRRLGESLESGVCVLLHGDLGAGKTVLVRGVGEALGVDGVRSPSFTLINEYETHSIKHCGTDSTQHVKECGPHSPKYCDTASTQHISNNTPDVIIHADLYRLDSADSLGLEEYQDSVMFVEWPDRWRNPPGDDVLNVYISPLSESEREIKITARGTKAEGVLMKL